jgi:hypothetical protein
MHEDGLFRRLRWSAVLLAMLAAGCSSQPEPPKPSSTESEVAPAKENHDTAKTKPTGEPSELFADWPKPQAVLVITGNQHGYLEPCGCTGLANQKGGLARRHSLIKQLVDKGWDVAPLDVGNQVRRFGPQAELQFQMTADALKKMGYRAIGLGHEDLLLSELLAAVASDSDNPGPFLSANVAVGGREFVPRQLVVETGGLKIGVTAMLGNDLRKKVTSPDVVQESVENGLKEVLPEFGKATLDFRVLLAFADEDEAREIAKRSRLFDLVVASSGSTDPTFVPEAIEGSRSKLVHTGAKGMFAIVIGLYGDGQGPKMRYERVPLDDRFPDSKEMQELMAGYQDQLKRQGLEGLGIKPMPHPQGEFVGTQTCGQCHIKALAIWEKTPHAHTTDTLIHPPERGNIPRHFDPECLSCHVTGWEPQKFFPFNGGYLSVEKTPEMMQNGCENCHGPGAEHVAAEGGADGALQEKLRAAMRLPLTDKVAERKCMECHDIDNSPDFHARGAFEKYWKRVEHTGKD